MKTILLATDFSNNSNDAAHYGYDMARHISANILLCNAIIVPAEVPLSGMVIWQTEEYDMLLEDSSDELNRFKTQLEKTVPENDFKPNVSYCCEAGAVTDVINRITKKQETDLIVIGKHTSGTLTNMLLGNHAHFLMDKTSKPILLVAPGTLFKPVKKIAFATDLAHLERDLKIIYELVTWAKLLKAEILLTHIVDSKYDAERLQKTLSDCLLDLSNKADYLHIYYKLVKNNRIEDGIDWLCQHGQIDMLAMVHEPRNYFSELFEKSHTKEVAGNMQLPLLIFPISSLI
jgi:nucleotide-binding universal stress UspA family protein